MSNDAAGRRVPLERQPALAEAVYAAAATLSGSTSAALARLPVAPAPASALAAPSPQLQQPHDELKLDTADDTNATSARRSKSQNTGTLAKRRISFQHKWLSKYGLRITSMDAVTSEVLVLACRLCEKFGREKVLVADDGTPKTKRRRSTTVKHFKPPWRSDNIAHHARDQHGRRFVEYDRLTEKQKEVYLEYTGPPQTEIIAVPPRPGALTVASSALHGVDSAAAAAAGHEQFLQYAPLSSGSAAPSSGPVLAPAPVALSHSTSCYERIVCLIDAPIVDTVVANVLLDCDSPYGALVHDAAQALAVFARASGGGRSLDRVTYTVSVPSRHAFELCLEFVATGAALTQCAALVNDAQVRLTIGAITTATVIGFVRMAMAMNLQVLASILERAWAFSLVLDGTSHSRAREPTSITVRVRVALGTALRDVHVLALPATERLASLDVYATLATLLTAISPGYEHKLVGIVTLGPPRVTAWLTDTVARLHASAPDGCYRIWSGAQHVTRVVERVLEQLFDEAFVRHMSALTGYLRTQRELIATLRGDVCPRFVDTRLSSLTRLIDWFALHWTDVKSYVDTKQPTCAPTVSWWVLMAALKRYCDTVTRAVATITGATAALGQQRASMDALLTELMTVGCVRGPFDNVYALGTAERRPFVFGAYAVTHDGAAAVLENLDPFVFELVEALKTASDGASTTTPAPSASAYATLVARVAFVFGETVRALAAVLESHDAAPAAPSDTGATVPRVLPHELVQLSGADMNRLLRTQQLRLLVTFTKDETSAIHSEHAALKTAYARDATFKAQLDRMTSAWSFDRAWSSVGELYPRLQTFCAGLATAFPDAVGSSSSARSPVAASRVVTRQYERSAPRTSLVDFGLEAMLQAQQYATLQDVATTMGL